MTLKEIKFSVIFSLLANMFLSCSIFYNKNSVHVDSIRQIGNNSIFQSEVEVTYWNDEGFIIENSEGISVSLRTGFDTLQQISFYINNSLIKNFFCKTNHSIGYCLLDNKDTEIAELYLGNKFFKEGNILKIVAGDNFINIPLKVKMKKYNRLWIYKASKWTAGFENSSRIELVE